RQEVLPGALVVAGQQGIRGEYRAGQVRPGVQGRAEFLKDDRLLGESETGTPVRLGDGQGLQAKLLTSLVPYRLVEAVVGLHQLADPCYGRAVSQESPD